ncbi:hypothetical protein HHL28_02845 [Aerophototrophica crusticola]|uniref:Uncharacterized protein n=1 Tax=Aerophototrophica crusticola TaxID=1709002 RepID=A0A858R4A6_9PROT|nr:hypothetical protein HHL28_02845 [Rhodospirillaceae bacterium B3]
MPTDMGQFMFAVVGLSMMVTPFLPALAERLVALFPVAAPESPQAAGPGSWPTMSSSAAMAGSAAPWPSSSPASRCPSSPWT